ncbi:MAG: hypothetical protein OXC60_19215 [Litoreibacter sp.]|nr:hypothetical protein [Litoreibacter sp.]
MHSRRSFFAGLLALAASPAAAQPVDIEASVRRQLRAQGFTDIRVNRTFLGRLRFVASNGRHVRELVINPTTGVILRDFTQRIEDGGGDTTPPADQNEGNGPGQSDDEDDDDDDDGDEGGGDDGEDDDD